MQTFQPALPPFSAIAAIFVFVYVLGIPVAMMVALWKNKKHLHDKDSPKHYVVHSALGGLYEQYEPRYWFFEIFLLLNKTLMCGGLVMAAPGTPLQVMAAVLIMLMHLLFVLKMSPYVAGTEDLTSFVSSLTLLLTTIGGFALKTNDPDNPAMQADIITMFLLTLAGASMIFNVGTMVFLDCGMLERIRGWKKIGGNVAVGQKEIVAGKSRKSPSKTKVNPESPAGAAGAGAGGDEEELNALRDWGNYNNQKPN